jgi:hypothetical protein
MQEVTNAVKGYTCPLQQAWLELRNKSIPSSRIVTQKQPRQHHRHQPIQSFQGLLNDADGTYVYVQPAAFPGRQAVQDPRTCLFKLTWQQILLWRADMHTWKEAYNQSAMRLLWPFLTGQQYR